MAIKDSIVNLKKGLRTTLTNVPALIDTLVRGLDGVEEEIEKGEVYSTEERVIGKWIDGSDIYEKVVTIPTLANTGLTSVDLASLNIAKMLYMNGAATSNSYTIPLPCAYGEGTSFTGVGVYYNYTAKDIRIDTFSDRSSYTDNFIIIRYTKASASRSPE